MPCVYQSRADMATWIALLASHATPQPRAHARHTGGGDAAAPVSLVYPSKAIRNPGRSVCGLGLPGCGLSSSPSRIVIVTSVRVGSKLARYSRSKHPSFIISEIGRSLCAVTVARSPAFVTIVC